MKEQRVTDIQSLGNRTYILLQTFVLLSQCQQDNSKQWGLLQLFLFSYRINNIMKSLSFLSNYLSSYWLLLLFCSLIDFFHILNVFHFLNFTNTGRLLIK